MNRIFLVKAFVVLPMFGAGRAKPVEYHSAAGRKQEFDELAAQSKEKNSGSRGTDMGSYDNHALKLSYGRETGGADVHSHFDDIMCVQGGSATLVAGGSLADPKTESNGEMKGKSVNGGVPRTLAAGDIVHIPTRTPQQLLLDDGADSTHW